MTEYAVQRWNSGWRVHRLDDHHGSYQGYYEVFRWKRGVSCTCPARVRCKHIAMVAEKVREDARHARD